MRKHILLDKAYTYENIPEPQTPNDCSYNRQDGLWRMNDNNDVMMTGDYARRPETKKNDVETGEDQKGE